MQTLTPLLRRLSRKLIEDLDLGWGAASAVFSLAKGALAIAMRGGIDTAAEAIVVATILTAILAGLAVWRRKSRNPETSLSGWTLIAVGCWVWAAGRMIQLGVGDSIEQQSLSGVAASLTSVATLSLLTAGLFSLRPPRRLDRDGTRLLLDLAVPLAVYVGLTWAWVWWPEIRSDALNLPAVQR